MASSITLSPAVEKLLNGEERATCCPQELVVKITEIQIRQHSVISRLFCCCFFRCCSNPKETKQAFQGYLEKKHKPWSANVAQQLVKRELPKLAVLYVRDAQKIMKKIKEIEARFDDINKLVHWANWHKVYQELKMQTTDEDTMPTEKWQNPTTLQIRDHGTIRNLTMAELYRMLEYIPIQSTQPPIQAMQPGDIKIIQSEITNSATVLIAD